jgi:adenylate cyclase
VSRKFSEAAGAFEELLSLDGDDPTTKMLLTRCREFLVNPPPANWDGSYTLKEK